MCVEVKFANSTLGFLFTVYSNGRHRSWVHESCTVAHSFSQAFRASRTSEGRLWWFVLHSLVLPQPLLRGWFVVTLVTGERIRNSFHFFSRVHCWRVLLPLEVFLSPPSIPPQGGGACLLLDPWACCLTPGVHGEGEVGTNGNGEVEGLALAGQCLAKIQALRKQGGFGQLRPTSATAAILVLLLN